MSNNVEDKFNLAANYIQTYHQKFNKNDLLRFYAFYKQSTVGELDKKTQSRPSFFKMQERAKYDAWAALGPMDQNKSMESYIELLTSLAPTWIDEVDESKSSSGSFGPCVSRPKFEEIIDDSEKSIEDFIREGNAEKLKSLLSEVDPSEVNSLDENGLGLIHWSSDRGYPDVLKVILNTRGIDINLQDNEGQTALFYASSCGHTKCVQLLLDHGADKDILDYEESSCVDVAYDVEMKKILSWTEIYLFWMK